MEPRGRDQTRIEIVTNFYRLNRKPVGNVGLYLIEFSPEIEDTNFSLRSRLIRLAKPEIEDKLGEFIRVGLNIAAGRVILEPFMTTAQGFDEIEYILSTRIVGTIDETRWDMYMMFSNSILKQMLKKLNLLQVTRLPKHYDRTQIAQVPAFKLEIWRGFLASFAHYYGDMLLNIDFASKIIRNTTVLDEINKIAPSHQRNLKQALERELVGKIVMASYGNFTCYRIEGIDIEQNPGSVFEGKNGPISYIDYYRSIHSVPIKDHRQHLIVTLINRGQKEIRLIPELCRLTGISEEMRSNYNLMNGIAKFTRLNPQERLNYSKNLAKRLRDELPEMSVKWSMGIDANPIKVNATRFQMETIELGPDKRGEKITQRLDDRGSFSMKNPILDPVKINNWTILSSSRHIEERDNVINCLTRQAGLLKITLARPHQQDFTSSNIKSLIELSNRSIDERRPPQIIVIILDDNYKDLYDDVKAASCCESGIPTQVIMLRKVRDAKNFDSIMLKLMLQIAAKTGSLLWRLSECEGIERKTMVIGIDVFHDTVNKAQSVVGFVASVHPAFTQYYNTVKLQAKSGEEIATSVGVCLREALSAFYERTKRKFWPNHIVVYRDGVGDSQIDAVRTYEIEGMKRVILEIENYNPHFTYIIVNKKTNAKLYLDSNRGIVNPLPGTVVHDVVVPDERSFYLISHSVTQGMASPTLYRIVDDNSGIDKMVFAKFAFKLCYMYYNWSGGIKVPAPTMMAHKLAYVIGKSVHSDYKSEIKLQPWFY